MRKGWHTARLAWLASPFLPPSAALLALHDT